jgi:XTP/dITP diphosphohydrolase
VTSVVLASHNRGKLAELDRLFASLDFSLVGLGTLDIAAPEETALTFVENALDKARHAATNSGLPAIADDSGLVVPALGGAPGIHSARYAGVHGDDAANNRRLVAELRSITDRRAYFYCALVFMRSPDDPAPEVATAAWHGEIIDVPRGMNGFGYDPHFWLADLGKTSAELESAEKDLLSHRGQAARMLLAALSARYRR